jgi:hypothetical protein
MTNINVKLALVGTTFQFSEKSYRLYKVGFTSAIIVCVVAILALAFTNSAQLSSGAIPGIAIFLNAVCSVPAYLAMNRDSKVGPTVEYISYLPVVHFLSLLVLCLHIFYNIYLQYGIA